MIEQYIKEDLSLAYVQAVAGRVNVGIARLNRDMGIDGTFRRMQSVQGRMFYGGCSLDFQLKASVDWACVNGVVKYDLEAPMHNVLAERNGEFFQANTRTTPCLLIVFCMPRDPTSWLILSENELLLRRCCYWHLVTGDGTLNLATVRVEIPSTQTLTPDSLKELLDAVEEGTLTVAGLRQ